MSNVPFKLIQDNTLQFLFLFSNADGFYLSARNNLQEGFAVPGCSNAHQSIELYIKALLKLNHEQENGHDLIKLLKKYQNRNWYFTKILQNTNLVNFLNELSKAYLLFRYGEAEAESNCPDIINLLDELAYNLRINYLKSIKWTCTKIYISDNTKPSFLRGNKYFKERDLTNNPLSMMGLPRD